MARRTRSNRREGDRQRRLREQKRRARLRPRAVRSLQRTAEGRLRRFRHYSRLAVAITALFLVMLGGGRAGGQESITDSAATEATRSVAEARDAFSGLIVDMAALLPKLGFALLVLLLAGLLTKLLRPVLRKIFQRWEKADAVSAMLVVGVWVLALAAAVSVLAGDSRAMLGSVGLLGLAASWALQAPIESFAGWLLNSFRGYYRAGDRIGVGDVFGDVYRIDVLTTTLWEAGGPDKPVQGAQPTGALVTFPNSEILRSSIVNYTRVFPYVWDEIRVGVANESDLEYAMRAVADVAREVVGPAMTAPAERYIALIESEGLALEVATEPQVYLEPAEAYTGIVVRYLVPARERRAWASRLHLRTSQALADPRHGARIRAAHPTGRIVLERAPAAEAD
jgi:small-conductance mechanosensitive channel